ncbi:MAG: DNA/RNA nuclease SfsA [Nitrospirae bacterium]|nr:DNA/RNA nuclease SfsA [Nitrospirota bacterium]
MRWPEPLIEGTLVRRYQRFLADVRLGNGEVVTAHCVNTGSMLGCRPEGAPVLISRAGNPGRKLQYTWELVRVDGATGPTWVGVNTGRANAIVAEAIEGGAIPELMPFGTLRREVKYGASSRIDILLESGGQKTYVEVKNTTLADGATARFPDSVSVRGAKHMRELAAMVEQGHRAAVVFLVQRGDSECFAPADHIDPAYGAALREAAAAGVLVLPCQAQCGPEGVVVTRRLEARL